VLRGALARVPGVRPALELTFAGTRLLRELLTAVAVRAAASRWLLWYRGWPRGRSGARPRQGEQEKVSVHAHAHRRSLPGQRSSAVEARASCVPGRESPRATRSRVLRSRRAPTRRHDADKPSRVTAP